MRTYILPLLLLLTTISNAQIKGKIIDSITKSPIQYVNIWVENENEGTTSNQNGYFEFNKNYSSKTIVFSAVGYETKKIEWDSISEVIQLNVQAFELKEFVINSTKEPIEKVVGEFKKSKINKFFGCGEKPKIWARFFPYSKLYNETPYLKKIKVFCISRNKNSKFNLRFYSIDSLGRPGEFLYDENIIGYARKGNKINEVDVSSYGIKIPKNGFFVAVEWLIIESNQYEDQYTEDGSKEKFKGFFYDPTFGTIAEETDQNSWSFTKGKWNNVKEDIFGDLKKKHTKRYSVMAIELTLSN